MNASNMTPQVGPQGVQPEISSGCAVYDLRAYRRGRLAFNDHTERQFIGCLFQKPPHIVSIVDILKPADLRDPRHRLFYDVLIRAFETDSPITVEAIDANLGKDAGIYIAELIAQADVSLDIVELAERLKEAAR